MKKTILKTLRRMREVTKTFPWLAHITFSLVEYCNLLISYIYRTHSFKNTLHNNCDNLPVKERNHLDIVTVAFNNPTLIETQINLIQKNLVGLYSYIVADNSTRKESALEIQNICHSKKVGYIKLPQNPWSQANLSHGIALNWIYHNFIKPRKAEYFGFIDHDIFPTEKISIVDKFSSTVNLYGHLQERTGNYLKPWYLWAGFCFFRLETVYTKHLNFSSVVVTSFRDLVGLDTGGGNWEPLYSQTNKKDIVLAIPSIKNGVEYLDSWIHLGKASFKTSKEINLFLETLTKK